MYGPHNVLPYLVANFKDALSEQCTLPSAIQISFIVKIWVCCRMVFMLQCVISVDEILVCFGSKFRIVSLKHDVIKSLFTVLLQIKTIRIVSCATSFMMRSLSKGSEAE